MPRYVVRLFVCDVNVCFIHRLKYFENNFTADYLKVLAQPQADPNVGNMVILVQREHPEN